MTNFHEILSLFLKKIHIFTDGIFFDIYAIQLAG